MREPVATSPIERDAAARLITSILLIAAGFAVYANSLGGSFLFDDYGNIVENERVHSLWPPGPYLSSHRPVLQFTFAVNYALGGLKVWGYHLVNVAIHLLAGLTLYGIVRRTILLKRKDRSSDTSSIWLAFVVALLWLIHPLQTQSVTYIIQRGESLMGLCYLLCLYGMIRGSTCDKPWRWYGVAVLICATGMGCKAVMVTAPVVMIVFDRVFLSMSWRQLARHRGVFFGCLFATWVVLGLCGVAATVFQTTPKDGASVSVGFAYKGIGPAAYAMTQPVVILRYLRLCFWPDSLCLDYQWPAVESFGQALGPALVVGALLLATIGALATRHSLGFAGAWFFLVLAPTSSFVPIKDVIFEHRMYLPLAAVVAVVVFGADAAWRRISVRFAPLAARGVTAAVLATLTVSLPLAWRTASRNRDYRSAVAMWQSVLDARPQSDRAHFGLGVALYREGRIDEAISQFEEAIAITPKYADAHFNMGVAYADADDWATALMLYRRAVALAPQRINYARALGDALSFLGRFEEAATVFRDAIAVAPNDISLRVKLADALADAGRDTEAVEAFGVVLSLDEDRNEVRINLGNALRRLGRTDEAIGQYRRVLSGDSTFAAAWANLGAAYAGVGRFGEAEEVLQRSIDLDPDLEPAYRALVGVLLKQHKTSAARALLLRRLDRDPNYDWAQRKLRELDGTATPQSDEHGNQRTP